MGILKKVSKFAADVAIDTIPGADLFFDSDDSDEIFDKDSSDESSHKAKKNSLQTPPPAVPKDNETMSVRIAVNGQEYGPYEKATLIEMISNGSLTPQTLVFMEGMTRWTPAAQVPKVNALFGTKGSVPPVPPVPWTSSPVASPSSTDDSLTSNLSPKLKSLVISAIADGEISDLERQVLIRNAQAEGMAIDEFAVIVDAMLYNQRQALQQQKERHEHELNLAKANAAQTIQPPVRAATAKKSEQTHVSKCPACGALRSSFAAICPDCGYEFSDAKTSDTLQNFFNEISKYDEQIANEAPKNKSIVGTIFLWWFFFPFMLVYFIIKTGTKSLKSLTGTKKVKADAIKMFPIPNSRNDLLEAAVLMQAEIKPVGLLNCLTNSGAEDVAWDKVWLAKLNSIIKKAEISMAGDTKSLETLYNIRNEAAEIVKNNTTSQYIIVGSLAALFIGFIICLAVF